MLQQIKKYGAFCLLALIGFILVFTNLAKTREETGEKTLIVGLQSGYPPFEYRDEKGQIVGFDVDLAERIAAKLQRKLVIEDMDFDGEILSLKQGKIDLIISGMQITPSREKELFLVPYHGDKATSFSLIFWEKIPEGVTSIADLEKMKNLVVSTQTATVSEKWFLTHYPKISSRSFEGALAPLMDIKYGKSVAALVESDVANYLQQKHPEIKTLTVPLAEDEKGAQFGIGINKKNKELLQQVQNLVEELKSSGEMKQLENKWFPHE